MSNADTMIWCCPTCHSSLDLVDTDLRCKSCQVRYPVIHDIPDLRVTLECWIDLDEDRERAREAADRVARDGLESAIRHIFRSSRGMNEKRPITAHARYLPVLKSVNPNARTGCSPPLKLMASSWKLDVVLVNC